MKRIFTLAFLFSVFVSRADQTVITSGSSWKYLDTGVDQGTTWKDVVFNDAGWSTGNAQLGYGEGDEATVMSYGGVPANKYPTYYFRKSVSIASVAAFANFQLNVKRDDGVVVYVNGVEAWRNNMGAGIIAYGTLAASDASDDGQTFINSTLVTSLFSDGNNVIAVEVHQFTLNSSDVSFDLNLTGVSVPPPPVVTRGAYLSLATPTSIYVRWRTDISSDTKVLYGTDPLSLTSSVSIPASVTDHVAQLTGLLPNTKYYYALAYSSGTIQFNQAENFFITPPVSGTVKPTRLWVTGDMGTSTAEQNQVRDAYYNYTGSTYTDLWLWLGDNAYNSGTDAEYQDHVFVNHYEQILKKTVVWPSAGNHDVVASDPTTQAGPYYDMFNFPTAGEAGGVASGTKAYYSYNYANIHFVVLESTTASFRVNGGAMQTWLQNDLTANTQKWTVIYFHHPPYSMGSHNSDTESQLAEMRTNFNPIIEQHKVDLVLCGHSHNYERTFLIKDHFGLENTFNNSNKVDGGSGAVPTPYIKAASSNFNGTVYAVVGVSGVIEGTSPSWPHEAMRSYSTTSYGSMVIDINGDTLDAKFIDNTLPNPLTVDQFRIIKQCDQAMTFPSISAVCQSASAFSLTGATPAGGVYSGTAVSGGIFNPSVAGAGSHTITYTYTSGFCTNSITQVIVVNPTPLPIISGPTSFCPGSSTSLDAGSGYSNYAWSNGATTQSINVNTAGIFTVTVTNGSGCTGSASVTTSLGNLTAGVTPSGTVVLCSGSSTVLSATAGTGYSYQWYRNNVVLATATGQSFTTSTAGTYKCVVSSASCSATTNSVVISVINNPTATFTYNSPLSFCSPGSVTFTANSYAGVVYQWENNNVAIAGATSVSYVATTAGQYRVKQTANGCDKYSGKVTVSTASIPAAAISTNDPTTLCAAGTVTMNVTSPVPGYNYQWQNNGLNIAGATGTSYGATASGNYTVKATASCGTGTSNSISVSIGSFNAQVSPSGTAALCSGGSLTLSANTGTGFSYQWMNNGVNIAGATGSTLTVSNSGSYSVFMSSACGTATSAATTVTIASVTASVTPAGSSTVCSGTSITYTANVGSGYTYRWYRNNVLLAATTQSFTTSTAGSYKVEVSVSGSCPVQSNTVVLTVTNNPTATVTAGGPTTFCTGQSVTLTTNSYAGVSYQWQKNSTNIAGATGQSYTATTTGSYRVQHTANGCSKYSAQNAVSVTNCARVGDNPTGQGNNNASGLSNITVFPNPFADKLNIEITSPLNEQTEIRVVDVLGKEQFKTTIASNVSYELNTPLPPGVYMVTAKINNQVKTIRIVKTK